MYCSLFPASSSAVPTFSSKTRLYPRDELDSISMLCIDSRRLNNDRVLFQIRLSNSGNNGMGRYWVEWDLPTDRKVDTFWRNSLGPTKVKAAANCEVEVRSSFMKTGKCYQNKFGMNGYYGGGYPSTTIDPKTLKSNDVCMTVAAVSHNSPLWHMPDWSKYYNDAPKTNTDWPNVGHIYGGPFLSVWLR